MHACMHTYVCTYVCTCIHTYLQTHTHTFYIYKYPQSKPEENENTVAAIESALNKQQASEKSPDEIEEEEAQQKEKLARDKAQEKAVITQLEDAINRLKTCIDHHIAVVMSDLPVGAILEIKHEKLKEAGVSISVSMNFFIEHSSIVHIYTCMCTNTINYVTRFAKTCHNVHTNIFSKMYYTYERNFVKTYSDLTQAMTWLC